MAPPDQVLWERFQRYYFEFPQIRLATDLSRMNFPDDFLGSMQSAIQKAFIAMAELEKGGIANPDENRMVGHYWLRNPALAPTETITREIQETVTKVKSFTAKIHNGTLKGQNGTFKNLLVIGIGGSALGPRFVANALEIPGFSKLSPYFFDNTDPDGIDKTLSRLGENLGRTLCVVISKSGGTKETRNGMLEAQAAYERAGLKFGSHAIAVTGFDSELDKYARGNGWLERFPMWDWVGGRTSEFSAVGLLPAALQGQDIDQMLAGARTCDEITRQPDIAQNPAAQLALMWYYATSGKGNRDMVVLPYKDRLELFSKYLQQLIMESLGKESDLDGKVVNQGIAVYGNKGSTDQHSYVQQLREGVNNFFVTFIEVLRDREGPSLMVEPEVTSGDYLHSFFMGTRQALHENGRESITITIDSVSPFSVGVLVALFERAVGLYASLININAYHQPGVEAGKKAASTVISLQKKIGSFLNSKSGDAFTAIEISEGIGEPTSAESVFRICQHQAANPEKKLKKISADSPSKVRFEAT